MNTIVEQLKELTTAEQVAVLNEYYDDAQYYDDKIYEFDACTIDDIFPAPWDAIMAAINGDIHMSDDYFRMDGYGNLQTLSGIQIENELVRDADIIAWLERNPDKAEDLGIETKNNNEEE